jgi:hypothetical protein
MTTTLPPVSVPTRRMDRAREEDREGVLGERRSGGAGTALSRRHLLMTVAGLAAAVLAFAALGPARAT